MLDVRQKNRQFIPAPLSEGKDTPWREAYGTGVTLAFALLSRGTLDGALSASSLPCMNKMMSPQRGVNLSAWQEDRLTVWHVFCFFNRSTESLKNSL